MFLFIFLRAFVRFALRQFYRSIHVIGSEKRVDEGALIVVANHPNTGMDPLTVASLYDRDLWFLAMAKLFRGRLRGWLMRRLHCLPVYRRQDGEDMRKNFEMFDEAIAHLHDDSALLVFPEGTSNNERRLAPMKTGPARIALLAEHRADFKLGLKIQPVGITYTEFGRFRSNVTLIIGDPIDVSAWRTQYAANPSRAVRDLTAEIGKRIDALTVSLGDLKNSELVDKLASVFGTSTGPNDHARLQTIATAVESLTDQTEVRDRLEQRIDTYLSDASELGLLPGEELSRRSWILTGLSTPFVLTGRLLHLIPIWATAIAAARTKDPTYTATNKLLGGILFCFAWYVAVGTALYFCLGALLAVGGLAALGLLGILANRNFPQVKVWLLSFPFLGRRQRLNRLRGEGAVLREQLLALHREAERERSARAANDAP